MIKVQDLIEHLQTLDQEMQVIWGWDMLPAWEACKEKKISDLPIILEDGWVDNVVFLRLADFKIIEGLQEAILYRDNLSGWEYLKKAFAAWRGGRGYRLHRKRYYGPDYWPLR